MKNLVCHAFIVATLITTTGLAKDQPNILVIVADDLGFSDLGCYGGEIDTPHLDRLASNGLRLTRFYSTGRCCPSRASILTGYYPHRVGLGHMTKNLGRPGYMGRLTPGVKTIAEILNPAGYRSFIAGKWHLGTPNPTQHGFQEFYGTLVSAKTFWEESHMMRMSQVKGGQARSYADKQFYATDAVTDHAIDFLNDARSTPRNPWFLYLAYHAPHFPLHAPKEDIAKFKDHYQVGWDVIRERRLERMKRLGIVPGDTPLSPRSNYAHWDGRASGPNPAWNSLDKNRQLDLAQRMAVYAAMVHRMDSNIGRVIKDLSQHRELDNTLIVFLSDNGACGEWDPFGFDGASGPTNRLHTGKQLDLMGSQQSNHSVGSGWANASNTPWRLYKQYNHEGGIRGPCIMHWPTVIKGDQAGKINNRVAHIIDLLPTIADAAGPHTAPLPEDLPGQSLTRHLKDEPIQPRSLYFEHQGNRAINNGRWKLVALRDQPWELYDLQTDPVELNDVARDYPDQVKALSDQWNAWAKANHVTPLPEDLRADYLAKIGENLPGAVGLLRRLGSGFKSTQGPSIGSNGEVYFTDIPNKRVYRWTQESGSELYWQGEDYAAGATYYRNGRLLITAKAIHAIVDITYPDNPRIVVDKFNGKPLNGPNDLWIAPNNSIYFTDPLPDPNQRKAVQDGGYVYHVDSTGLNIRRVSQNLFRPNGIVGSEDGTKLYVAALPLGFTFKYTIRQDGSLTPRRVAADEGSGGLAVDQFGNVYITRQSVKVYAPTVDKIAEFTLPETPSNVTFGGTLGRTLFITAGTGLYSLEMNVRGNHSEPNNER